jgi:hypothetical protein
LRDKKFWALRHNATSTLPWEPQADEHVLTLIGLAPQGNEKAGPFQIRLPPPVAFGDKLYDTHFMPQLFFAHKKFSSLRNVNNH